MEGRGERDSRSGRGARPRHGSLAGTALGLLQAPVSPEAVRDGGGGGRAEDGDREGGGGALGRPGGGGRELEGERGRKQEGEPETNGARHHNHTWQLVTAVCHYTATHPDEEGGPDRAGVETRGQRA